MKKIAIIIFISIIGSSITTKAQTDLNELDGFFGVILGYNIGNYDAKLVRARDYKITKLQGKDFNYENEIETNLAGNITLMRFDIQMNESDWRKLVDEYKQKYISSNANMEFAYGKNYVCWISSDREKILEIYHHISSFDKKEYTVIKYGYVKK